MAQAGQQPGTADGEATAPLPATSASYLILLHHFALVAPAAFMSEHSYKQGHVSTSIAARV
jgi:hypothetical protein